MEKSLYNEYERLLSSNNWKYYPFDEELGMKIFSDKDSIIGFFVNYLETGGKGNMPFIEFMYELPVDRLQHTLSCFLLGMLVYEKCSSITCGICKELQKIPIKNPEAMDERFKYLWMLISIFHDFGYAIENKDKELCKKDFDKMMTTLHSRPRLIPNIYSKELLRKYNKYRLCRFGVYDHGICGGIKLYTDLYELREKKAGINDQALYWGEDLVRGYSLAAWTVACHNIWLVKECEKNEKTIRCYNCLKLEDLIYHDFSRDIKKSPFLYLLCLVDSIEPVKIFKNSEILNHIVFDFSKTGNIEIQTVDLNQVQKNKYLPKIVDLNDWLTDVNDTTITL